jgi:hypothetical protein
MYRDAKMFARRQGKAREEKNMVNDVKAARRGNQGFPSFLPPSL